MSALPAPAPPSVVNATQVEPSPALRRRILRGEGEPHLPVPERALPSDELLVGPRVDLALNPRVLVKNGESFTRHGESALATIAFLCRGMKRSHLSEDSSPLFSHPVSGCSLSPALLDLLIHLVGFLPHKFEVLPKPRLVLQQSAVFSVEVFVRHRVVVAALLTPSRNVGPFAGPCFEGKVAAIATAEALNEVSSGVADAERVVFDRHFGTVRERTDIVR